MAKGLFTQGFCLLTNGQTAIEDIKFVLQSHGFEVVKETAAQSEWCFSGPSLVIPFLPEVNGYAAVDVVDQPWPDTMGDPKSDPMTFGAWSMGHFGPFAFPGSLARARDHARPREMGVTVAESHLGFIRIRLSYIFGCNDNATVFPEHYDSLAEMNFLNRAVLALIDAPGVLCYFNPNGEVLRDRKRFRDLWDGCRKQQKVSLLLWTNTRSFILSEKLGFMDTVGNSQLEIRDVEAIFPQGSYHPGDIDYYLRNVTHYLLDLDREMQTGEAMDGPGESNLTWTIEMLDKGVIEPPRQVLRLYPKAIREAVHAAIAAIGHSPS
jgi:Domain of unknown function (DUF4261)